MTRIDSRFSLMMCVARLSVFLCLRAALLIRPENVTVLQISTGRTNTATTVNRQSISAMTMIDPTSTRARPIMKMPDVISKSRTSRTSPVSRVSKSPALALS